MVTAESILKAAIEDVYRAVIATVYTYTPASELRRMDAAIGLLWDARKYLGCYSKDTGKVRLPGLYAEPLQ